MADARITLGAVDNTRAAFDSVKGNLQGLHTQATAVIGALGAVVSVAGLVAWVQATVDGVDALNDLKDATGSTIENISALEDIARRSGTSFDTVSTSMIKFNGILNNAKPGSDAELALRALNLNVKELKEMDPADALLKTAVAMSKFADDGDKARLMQELFGKSTKDVAAFLKDLAEKGKLVATVTTAQADEAEKFNKQLADIGKNAADASRALAGPMVAAINQAITKFKEGRAAGKGFFESLSQNYWDNVRDFYGAKQPNTGGATGSWADPEPEQPKPTIGPIKSAAEIAAAASASQKALAEQNKELSQQSKLLAELAGISGSFAEDWDRLTAIYKFGKLSLEGLTKAQADLLAKQPAIKAANDAEAKAAELAKKAFEEADKARLDYNKGINDGLDKLYADTAALEGRNARLGLSTLAIADLDAAELDLQATKLDGLAIDRLVQYQDTLNYDMLKLQAEEKRKLASLTREGATKSVAVEEAKAAATEWKRTTDDIERGLTDSLFRAFEAGKGFFSSLWSGIKNLFKTTVLKLAVQGVMTGVGGALGMSGTANAATGGGGILGLASNASSLYSGVSSMLTLGSQVVAGTMSVANALGTVAANATGTGISGLLATNGAYGTAAAGTAAGSATAVLAAIPVWGWVAMAAIGAAAIFGGRGDKESTGGGIEGKFGAGGFSGSNFNTWQQDGGWFHSDRSGKETSGLDSATQQAYNKGYASLQTSATTAAAALGLSATAITSYSQDISLQLGSDAAANQKAVEAMFAGIANNLATAVAPGLAALAKDGEAGANTLQRLSTSLTTTNSWLSMLKQRLYQVSLASGDAASKLVDVFGGLENFTAASQAFYDTYYTEGERVARSQEDMTKALALVNLTLPTTKDGLRELAGSLDLNTEAGRAAYAVLLKLAPEFAVAADLASKFAGETADKLMAAFTGNGRLNPALVAASLRIDELTTSTTSTGTAAGYISTQFLEASSGLLGFGGQVDGLTLGLTASQQSAALLAAQLGALKAEADSTRIDFVNLGQALAEVNTETFVATMAKVFENLADRIKGVLGDISTERIAVREAALEIINPTVMTKAGIQRSISSIGVNLPSNAGVVVAGNQLTAADAAYARSVASAATLHKQWADFLTIAQAGVTRYAGYVADAESARASLQAKAGSSTPYKNILGETITGIDQKMLALVDNALQNYKARLAGETFTRDEWRAKLQVTDSTSAIEVAAAANLQAAAVANARAQQLAYAAALQNFAIDANNSVTKLGKLREETVKYYEAQKALAGLMSTSAAALRTTVADYKYSQMTPEQQFADLQTKYATAYSMALSNDGETLAGYGDKLNGLLNPLLEKAKEVLGDNAYNTFAATMLARADNVAGRLEALTPTNYAADSLAMLGTIDATLAALDASSRSAEKIISDAVAAGSDKTANGLRSVIAAITGQSIPAFAGGGSYMGGLALVGEEGPELINFSSPGHVYTANQTSNMLSGGSGNTARLEELVARQTQELNDMRFELRSIASSNAKIAKFAEKADGDGMLVRTDADAPLKTVAA